ncbi:MAG: Eco57I restriction-modification methylase domain-containing protein [bacterium]
MKKLRKLQVLMSFLSIRKATNWFDPFWMFAIDRKFDIVIGNPPYVRQEKIKDIKETLKNQKYEVFDSKADIYVYFFEKGLNLLENDGILAYISSNKWMRASYGSKLRKLLKEKSEILKIIDFGGYPVFEQSVDTCIVILRKRKFEEEHEFYFVNVPSTLKDHNQVIKYVYENQKSMFQKDMLTDILVLEDRKILGIKEKIEKLGKPLKDWNVKIYRGIITGFNEAFVIDTETREKILKNCRTKEERERTEKIIKPVLKGRDIQRYYYEWKGLWLIVIPAGWTNKNKDKQEPEEFFKNTFHSVYSYLKSFEDFKSKGKGLYNRDDQGDYWWELRHCDYYPEFEKEKIVWQENELDTFI